MARRQAFEETVDKWMPLYLSTIAGLSTCIGAGIVFMYPKGKPVSAEMMSFSLAMAGSVMVTVSLVSIGPECVFVETEDHSERTLVSGGELAQRILAFGFGSALYFFLSWCAFPEPDEILGFAEKSKTDDRSVLPTCDDSSEENDSEEEGSLLRRSSGELRPKDGGFEQNVSSRADNVAPTSTRPSSLNKRRGFGSPLEISRDSNDDVSSANAESRDVVEARRAWRVVIILFVSLLCHNFPEGLAVAASALSSTRLGLTVMFGIMIHNIPEGIAIAVPCLQARPNQPWLAFLLASVSGLAEPLGAWFALVILKWDNYDNEGAGSSGPSLGNVLSFVAGIMITVSFRELFPEAKRHCKTDDDKTNERRGQLETSSSLIREDENITQHLLHPQKTNIKAKIDIGVEPKQNADRSISLVAYNMGLVSGCVIMIITELFMET